MNSPNNRSVVIFDLDGTLVDSAPDIASSICHALNHLGLPLPNIDSIRNYIGNGADRLIHRALTGDIDGVAECTLFRSARELFYDHYANNVCHRSEIYPKVTQTLTTLKTKGYDLACVTNKPGRFTRPLLKQLGLDDFFSVTLSGDSLEQKKPAPDQLLHVADSRGVPPQQCTMVGDSINDIQAAHRANMKAICVSYGYDNIPEIEALLPSAIVDSFDQILNSL